MSNSTSVVIWSVKDEDGADLMEATERPTWLADGLTATPKVNWERGVQRKVTVRPESAQDVAELFGPERSWTGEGGRPEKTDVLRALVLIRQAEAPSDGVQEYVELPQHLKSLTSAEIFLGLTLEDRTELIWDAFRARAEGVDDRGVGQLVESVLQEVA